MPIASSLHVPSVMQQFFAAYLSCGHDASICPLLPLFDKKMFYIFVMKGQPGINCCRDLLSRDISELCWSRGGFRELVNGKPL